MDIRPAALARRRTRPIVAAVRRAGTDPERIRTRLRLVAIGELGIEPSSGLDGSTIGALLQFGRGDTTTDRADSTLPIDRAAIFLERQARPPTISIASVANATRMMAVVVTAAPSVQEYLIQADHPLVPATPFHRVRGPRQCQMAESRLRRGLNRHAIPHQVDAVK